MKSWLSDISNQFSGKELRKVAQKKRIITYLYRKGDQTNAFLAQKLHISIPTVQTVLNELISEGLVTEKGLGNSSGGRRPINYGLTSDSFYTVGVDVNRYATRVAIYNNQNENITGIQTLDVKLENRKTLIDDIAGFTKQVIANSKLPEQKIIGVGLDMPGLIDSEKGINYTYLNFETPVGKAFEEKLQLKVHLENDARARALAELRFGAAQNKKNVLVLLIDWGVGLGMIMDGKLYRGSSGFAGEFSHTPIQDEGILCHCGKHGCLETIASGMALSKRIQEGLKAGNQSMLTSMPGVDISQLKLETIIEAINKGDMFSISLISNMAHHLGKGIATLISILNPELVILGGRLSKAGEYLVTPIKQSLYLHCIPQLREDVQISVSAFDVEAGVLGAIAVLTENTFN